MCAIAGVLDLDIRKDNLHKMLNTMLRRGPDGKGIFTAPGCALLHTRLAIIDPSGGAQPMTCKQGSEEYTIVYNGELYNTAELRQELKELGHNFTGHSDTEVVLHSYMQWGSRCLNRLNGIFAFAIWESRRRRLFLARDRIGVKPLFYALHTGGLLFASEIKTLLAYPTMQPQLDAVGAAQVLMLGPGRIPGSGVFRGICELEAGWCGYWEQGHLELQRYWQLEDREHTDSFDETCEKVRYLVTDAIERQTVSDVEIGCFLSGGLDSSIISAVCAEKIRGIHTFSLDYQDNARFFTPGKFQPNSDTAYIRIMENALQPHSHWTVLTSEDLIDNLESATIARDLPGMADVDFSLLAFCKDIRKEVKVALSGECADEIFGGYPWFRDPAVRAQEGFPWAQNTTQRSLLMHPQWRSQIDPQGFVMDQYQTSLSQCSILPSASPQERRMKEMVNLNFRWFMQTLLDRKDRMSMYHGLEVRVPFCDYRIAEYLYSVPWEYKNYQGREKGLLRRAMEGVLPEEILYRKKSPFPKTHHPEYLEKMKQKLESLLLQPDAPLFQLVDRSQVRAFIDHPAPQPWYGQLMTLPQTIAYLLQMDFWLREYKICMV